MLESPNSLMILKNAISSGIDGYIIKTLNYIDLQTLVLNLNIDKVKQLLKELRQQQLSKRGIKAEEEATASDYEKL